MANKIVCQNRKAYHDYFIEETYEAGMVLEGCEVKSLRDGRASLKESFARVRGEEVFLCNMHITPYKQGDTFTQPDPTRTRKLLLNKREIKKLIGKTKEKGYTLIPTKVYFKRGKAKVALGLGKGKKHYDKRDTLKKKTVEREVAKEFKEVKLKH
ncbi:MAG: SsrA-binding protein SmpB [Thermodesulfobacteriota bacterium]